MSEIKLAASAEMLYLDLPFEKRVEVISEQGFLVENWNWANKDLVALSKTGAYFQSMTGYLEGDLIEEDGIARLLETAAESIEASKIIGCDNLNIHGTGLDESGQAIRKKESVTKAQWLTATDTLSRLADLGMAHNKIFTLENLSLAVYHPGTPFCESL